MRADSRSRAHGTRTKEEEGAAAAGGGAVESAAAEGDEGGDDGEEEEVAEEEVSRGKSGQSRLQRCVIVAPTKAIAVDAAIEIFKAVPDKNDKSKVGVLEVGGGMGADGGACATAGCAGDGAVRSQHPGRRAPVVPSPPLSDLSRRGTPPGGHAR